MARRPRFDGPGALHHIVNRGLAKRPIFHGAEEVRYFLSRIALAVRRGEIEVLAFVFIPNHFHLLARTIDGSISSGIGRSENEYVRWFNRRQRRDGPLFRGRFASKVVTGDVHLRMTVRYIDRNAVKAGLVLRARDYPWGSAMHYANGSRPPWLTGTEIEGAVCEQLGLPHFDPSRYEEVFCSSPNPNEDWLVERGLASPDTDPESWDDLLRGAPAAVRDWMARKACVADNGEIRAPLVPPDGILSRIVAARDHEPGWTVRPDARRKPGWTILAVGLLRTASGLSALEIERRLGLAKSKVYRAAVDHSRLMQHDDEYARRATTIASESIREFYQHLMQRPAPSR